MRTLILSVVLATLLALPADAQFRGAVQDSHSSSRLYDATSATLDKLFSPSVFRMSHSFEMSAGSLGGHGYSMGLYTNSLAWQFNDKLAARMDVSVAYSPQNEVAGALGLQQSGPKVFLRSADIAWRPSKKFQMHLQVRQNPYGGYMGRHAGYHLGHFGGFMPYYGQMYAGYGDQNLFWRDDLR